MEICTSEEAMEEITSDGGAMVDSMNVGIDLSRALSTMPSRWVEIFALRMEGVSYADIGARWGISANSIFYTDIRLRRRIADFFRADARRLNERMDKRRREHAGKQRFGIRT